MNADDITAGSEHWYESLFRSNPLPMLIYRRDTLAILDANPSARQQYGYAPDEWKGKRLTDLHVPADLARVTQHIASHQDAPCFAGIWEQQRKDGTLIEVDVVRYPISFLGQPAALAIHHDVTGQYRVHEALRRAEQDLNQAQRVARLGSWVRDFSGGEDRWSDQTYRNFGLPPQSIAPGPDAFVSLLHPEDKEKVAAALREALEGKRPFACTHRVVWPDGSTHIMQEHAAVVFDDGGKPTQMIGTTLDVTERQQVESELRRMQKDLQRAERIAHIGTWTLDPVTGTYDCFSEETYRVFGLVAGEMPLTIQTLAPRIHPEDRERVMQARSRAFADPGSTYDVEFRILNPAIGERVVHSMGEVVRTAYGQPIRMVGFMQDITEQKCAEEQIRHLAYYDKITGLPNRVLLEETLDEALSRCVDSRRSVAVLMIHLTRFRDINYTLGYGNGERLVKMVGARIADALRGQNFVARTGNAQFTVLLPDADVACARHKALEMLDALERPFPIAGINYEMGAHIGIALAPLDGSDCATLIRKADVALYLARQSGQPFVVYDAATDPYKPQRLAMIGEFRKSVQAGELQLYCQPKASLRTGEIVGVEALVRWAHPKFGMVKPDQFLPLIESTDLIHPLTKFMLEASVRQCHEWRRHGVALQLAVNLSPRNLTEPDLVSNLQHLLASWGAEPDWLAIEITESSLIVEPQTSIAELGRLSSMGFRLFIDDFGTGYSSLSYLMCLPVDVIKIDHSFTMRMIEDSHAATIVKSTIDLAHNLGMNVVAEGAATRQIWDELSRLGCDEAQGYFISPPMPAQDFLDWLDRSGHTCSPIPAPPHTRRGASILH